MAKTCRTVSMMMALSAMVSMGAEISGQVFAKTGGVEKVGIADMLVSDGYGFAVTDEHGRYKLELNPKARTVYVQRDNRFTADVADFWKPLKKDQFQYDFVMTEVKPATGDMTVIQVADIESHELDYVEAVKKYIRLHPGRNLFVVAGDISAQSSKGLKSHLEAVNGETLGCPVAYVCGNHDIDFRGRWEGGEECPFGAVMGPWWESFIYGDYLFVTGPMYNSWGAPLVYDMLDFGDYLKTLCDRYPGYRKILLVHDLPDLVGYRVAYHGGEVVLDDEGFEDVFFGHKHMNIVRKYASGRKAYSVAPPNKGSAGCFPFSIRVTKVTGDSRIYYWNLIDHLEAMFAENDKRELIVSVVAYDGVDDVMSVKAEIQGKTVDLKRGSDMAWCGVIGKTGQGAICKIDAMMFSGKKMEKEFPIPASGNMSMKWISQLDGNTALAEPLLLGDKLFVAVSDDANGDKGGVCAIDAETGALLWKATTGYSVRNNLATDSKRVFCIDTRANIHAFDVQTGQCVWKSVSDSLIVSPAASGVAYDNGIVIGGYGRHLRGLDAASGKVLWRNNSWAVEERTPAEDRLALLRAGKMLVLSRLNGLYCHDTKTGKIVWLFKSLFASGTPCVDGTNVWLVGNGNELIRLNDSGERIASTRSVNCFNYSGSLVRVNDDLLLVGSGNNGLAGIDPVTIKEKWRFTPGPALWTTADYATGKPPAVTATPTVDGDSIWIPCNDGVLYKLGLDGRIIAKCPIGAPLLTKCIVNKTEVYWCDAAGRIGCSRPF